ncbi:MAG: hypothetical protein AAF423_00070 [Pseudomonadota bacterium]
MHSTKFKFGIGPLRQTQSDFYKADSYELCHFTDIHHLRYKRMDVAPKGWIAGWRR